MYNMHDTLGGSKLTEEIKNPYPEMPEDVLSEHLKQIGAVVKEKKVDVTQYFGASVSEDDKNKLEQFDVQAKTIKELNEAASAKDLTENEKILSQASIDSMVSDIRKVDPDAPLLSILESKFNNLDKLSILSGTEGIVDHYVGQISTLKKEFSEKTGNGTQTGQQTFSTPGTKSSAQEIIVEMTKVGKKE